jgi:hypothetical protein
VGQPGVGEGPDEGAVRARGVEDAERLGELVGLVSLVPEVAALLQPGDVAALEPDRVAVQVIPNDLQLTAGGDRVEDRAGKEPALAEAIAARTGTDVEQDMYPRILARSSPQ